MTQRETKKRERETLMPLKRMKESTDLHDYEMKTCMPVTAVLDLFKTDIHAQVLYSLFRIAHDFHRKYDYLAKNAESLVHT